MKTSQTYLVSMLTCYVRQHARYSLIPDYLYHETHYMSRTFGYERRGNRLCEKEQKSLSGFNEETEQGHFHGYS